MGTTIPANAFLRDYHSALDLNGSTSNCARPIYHENQILNNGQNPGSFTSLTHKNGYLGYEIEKVRQTIIEHESIFRNQLQELHRLYGRQKELMNEIKRREISKDDLKDKSVPVFPSTEIRGSSRTSEPWFFTSSIFPKGNHNLDFPNVYSNNMETQMQERYFKLPGVENKSSYDRDTTLSLGDVKTSQRNTDALKFDLLFKKRADHRGDLSITDPRDGFRDNHRSSFNPVMKDFFQTSPDAEKRRFDEHSSVKNLCFGKSLLAEPRKELSHCTSSVSRRKNKIFGIEMSEGDDNPFDVASKNSSTLDSKTGPHHENHGVVVQNLGLGGKSVNNGETEISMSDFKGEISSQKGSSSCHSDMNGKWLNGHSSIGLNFGNTRYDQCKESDPKKCFKNLVDMNTKPADSQSNHENPKSGLPWFLKDSHVSGDQSKSNKTSYFMNLDSLQNCSQKFFGKADKAEGTFQTSEQKKEISAPMVAKKLEINENNNIADLRHHIDLNLSLDEEEAPSTPTLPTTIVKIATTEIDLEAPAVIEQETNATYAEHDKIAAEAIIAISSLKNPTDDNAREPPLSAPADRLQWFAEVMISSDQSGPHDEPGEEHVPDGMDHFEFMTLKLKDTKEEQHYHHDPVVLKNDDDNEFTPSKRGRRGQFKRGRQRKDFQKDILPGMVTLSRLQVTEDFQAFEEMMKSDWPSSQRGTLRNGRGRRRLGGRNTTLTTKAVQQPVCQVEERSLTGWGKRTRRLPRQRCISNNGVVSFAVKC